MKKEIKSKQAPAPIGPYSQAIKRNGWLFVSGQIALHPQTGELITSSIEEETMRVMENIAAILHEAGYGFEEVVKTTIFLKNMKDFAIVNEVYARYVSAPFPARETVEVAQLPRGVNVEISVIAVK